MDGSCPRLEKFLQREVGDPQLRVMWDQKIERYVIGRRVASLASDFIDWFMVVTDGNSGYRPIDHRTVRKIESLDTWKRPSHLKPSDFIQKVEDAKTERAQARSEIIKYRLRHDSRYIKKAAVQDGLMDGMRRVNY
jgi:hypothetical protein